MFVPLRLISKFIIVTDWETNNYNTYTAHEKMKKHEKYFS